TQTDDPAPGGKTLVGFAQGGEGGANRRPQTEDQRVQDPHAEPYADLSSLIVRGIDGDGAEITRARRPRFETALSSRWCRAEQLSRTGRYHGAASSFRIKDYLSNPNAESVSI